jgi:hypothetical protein
MSTRYTAPEDCDSDETGHAIFAPFPSTNAPKEKSTRYVAPEDSEGDGVALDDGTRLPCTLLFEAFLATFLMSPFYVCPHLSPLLS